MRLRVQLYGTRGQATPLPGPREQATAVAYACYIANPGNRRNAIPIDATSCHT